jgi:hypothetical protein
MGPKNAAGDTQPVSPLVTTTYSLECKNSVGVSTGVKNVTITVTPVAVPAPTLSFTASPLSILLGDSSTLTWTTTNAAACTASGGWNGPKSTGDTQTVSPLVTTTYSLRCRNNAGTWTGLQSQTVTVTVPPLSVNITSVPAGPTVETTDLIKWTATASGGVPPYTFSWTGPVSGAGTPSFPPNTSKNYIEGMIGSTGSAIEHVVVTDSAGTNAPANHTLNVVDTRLPQ